MTCLDGTPQSRLRSKGRHTTATVDTFEQEEPRRNMPVLEREPHQQILTEFRFWGEKQLVLCHLLPQTGMSLLSAFMTIEAMVMVTGMASK